MRQHGQLAPLYKEGPMPRAEAVNREKELKGWYRKKKQDLIAKASEQIQ
jgi:predicted GIY-YIG superfamily endonuclease